MKGSTSNQSN